MIDDNWELTDDPRVLIELKAIRKLLELQSCTCHKSSLVTPVCPMHCDCPKDSLGLPDEGHPDCRVHGK